MNTTSFTPRKDDVPSCYGKDWDRTAPECTGGADPSYTDAAGSHVRPQCDFFQACGVRVQAARSAQVIPTANLLRPGVVTPPAPTPVQPTPGISAMSFAESMRQRHAAQIEAQRQAAMVGPRPPVPLAPPQQQQYQPMQYQPVPPTYANYPAASYQLNYTMPAYLTTPEVREPGESIWSVVGREIIRSLFKAVGHAIAHAFDQRTLKGK